MFKNLSVAALGLSATGNELIELALSHGFKGLDLDLRAFQQQVQLRGLPHSRRLYDSAKLKWGSFTLPVDLEADDATFKQDLAKLAPLAELARDLGCTRATTVMAPASDERPYHQNFELHRQRFAAVGQALAPYKIRLGVEFVAPAHHRQGKSFEFIHKLDALVMLLGMAGQPNVGLSIDLWQLHVSGAGIEALRKLSAAQVVTVSLADAPADLTAETATEESRLPPGETGVIDTAAALTILAGIGYDGPLTPKPHSSHFQGQKRELMLRQISQSLDTAWKAAGLNPAGKLTAVSK